MAAIEVIVGSVYGAAILVAESLEEALVAAGHTINFHEEVTLSELDASHPWLIVTSTTGQGELPPDLLPLFMEIQDRCPPIPQLRYGLVALGDSSYDNFCGAGVQFNALLQELEAQPLAEMLKIDAGETLEPEEPALAWLSSWIEKL